MAGEGANMVTDEKQYVGEIKQYVGEIEHRGIAIRIDRSGRFSYDHPEEEYPRYHVEYAKAVAEIDGYLHRTAKSRPLSLAVINTEGVTGVIRAIHIGQGDYLTTPPKLVGKYGASLYPSDPFVATKLGIASGLRQHAVELVQEAEKVIKALEPFRIGTKSPMGRGISEENYAEAVEDAERIYAEKVAALADQREAGHAGRT